MCAVIIVNQAVSDVARYFMQYNDDIGTKSYDWHMNIFLVTYSL